MTQVKDLKDQIGTPGPRSMLFCAVCGAECSTNSGDYFNCSPEHIFTCCGEPMRLVVKRTIYEEVM